jgi:hypothetical protein
LTKWMDPATLATLAAAYAEAGDFESALDWQARANSAFRDPKDKEEGNARLKLFSQRKPYHDSAKQMP